jgi:hypothetical protein
LTLEVETRFNAGIVQFQAALAWVTTLLGNALEREIKRGTQ